MQDYKKLEIYKIAKEASIEIYKATDSFPPNESYNLVGQLRRASFSIGSNIAEGCGRFGRKDFLKFLSNSLGSLREVQYQLELSHDLGYLNREEYTKLEDKMELLGKKLFMLIKSVRSEL